MVNIEMLKTKIEDSGMTMVAISKKTGILRETLYNRLSGKTEFSVSEAVSIAKVLHLSKVERDVIFFGSEVELNETNKQDNKEKEE